MFLFPSKTTVTEQTTAQEVQGIWNRPGVFLLRAASCHPALQGVYLQTAPGPGELKGLAVTEISQLEHGSHVSWDPVTLLQSVYLNGRLCFQARRAVDGRMQQTPVSQPGKVHRRCQEQPRAAHHISTTLTTSSHQLIYLSLLFTPRRYIFQWTGSKISK